VPAGAAAAAVVAALLWQREEAAPPAAADAAIVSGDLDLVAGGEDFGLLAEDADFVAWAAQETPDGVG
jgi:hypothetical protein